jgi:pyruvate ferredoxin oxidoreductase gamma subunit
MIRIRFHGRGGQGVKVASRIIGTAGFKAGFHAQDSPLYGAERRGAPVAAFTRLAKEAIQERGAIQHPDLVVVFDETLLDDPTINVIAGLKTDGIIAINTPKSSEEMQRKLDVQARVVCQNVTATAMALLGRNVLSGSFTGVVAKLVGFPATLLGKAMAEELENIQLDPSVIEKNVEAARLCYEATPDLLLSDSGEEILPEENGIEAYDLRFFPAGVSSPTVLRPRNATFKKTGNWRQLRPVLIADRCRPCFTCYLRCPEGAISLGEKNYPFILYDYCKGCMVCYEVCPAGAFRQEVEARA